MALDFIWRLNGKRARTPAPGTTHETLTCSFPRALRIKGKGRRSQGKEPRNKRAGVCRY